MSPILVITSIHAPNAALKSLASGCMEHGWGMLVAGDRKSPASFELEGCDFLSLAAQKESGFRLAEIAPIGTYTRKNLAYLEAIRRGAGVLVETDDDNLPLPEFWQPRQIEIAARQITDCGWVNAYRYFTDAFIYPRGMPLDQARNAPPQAGAATPLPCPIQQGLADEDPDVDAVYRMLFPLPFSFRRDDQPIWLGPGVWCPFNSQNTTFFPEAFPLAYLPAGCSFRMTDIWRSFVAQRILHVLGYGLVFTAPTVWQERNEHNLHQDFMDELPGYKSNTQIRERLEAISLDPALGIFRMMELCYQELIRQGWVDPSEESLLQAWCEDLQPPSR